jgi:hypothetical protein
MLSLQGNNIVSDSAVDIETFLREHDFGVPIYVDGQHLYLVATSRNNHSPHRQPLTLVPSLTCKPTIGRTSRHLYLGEQSA